ncbi:MAG: DUF6952 family protein [Thermaurantimonas sp.]
MKIQAIKDLLRHDIEALKKAEQQLYDEQPPEIPVAGEDEGEMLTHVLAAIWIKEQIQSGVPEAQAVRAFTQRVRNSIS